MDALFSRLPKHEAGLTIEHQPHKANYETVEEWARTCEDFVSEEERQKAISTDQLWTLQWYPATPIGFHCVAASSLEAILKSLA